jgi:trk system potassium uptake protein TrkA
MPELLIIADDLTGALDTGVKFSEAGLRTTVTTRWSDPRAGEGADVAVIGIGAKIDVSILTTLNVMKLGVKRVIAKATSEEQGEVLTRLGAEVIYPERDMALRTAGKLASPHILEYISLSDTVDIMELTLTPRVDGRTVLELNVRQKWGLNIIAIRRGGEVNISITPQTKVSANDTLAVVGRTEDIARFEEYLHGRD